MVGVDTKGVTVSSIGEGTIVMPRLPLMRLEGPIAIVQMLETQVLNLVNFSSLVATNASRFRLAAGPNKTLLEFGLRRAQGPDGALSASRYSFQGGFDATSNVLAAEMFNLPCAGTHAHSFVTSFLSMEDAKATLVSSPSGGGLEVDLGAKAIHFLKEIGQEGRTNLGELGAFVVYAAAFPKGFVALVDTYDSISSGLQNFIAVALALDSLGYKPIGIRLDSGDLAYLSRTAREQFKAIAERFKLPYFADLKIIASNDLDVSTVLSLNAQGHEIDVFGVGTNLVTCSTCPALGGVFKLVEMDGMPRMKFSQELAKMTIPGRKDAYRLYVKTGSPVLDLLVPAGDPAPVAGQSVLCQHPYQENKQVYVIPSRVEKLNRVVLQGGVRAPECPERPIGEIRAFVLAQLTTFRDDYLRFLNPTPYKVSVTEHLRDKLRALWKREANIVVLE